MRDIFCINLDDFKRGVTENSQIPYARISFSPQSGCLLEMLNDASLLVNGSPCLEKRVLNTGDVIRMADTSAQLRLLGADELQTEWDLLLTNFGLEPLKGTLYSFSKFKDKSEETYTGWKFHVFADREADAYNMLMSVVFPTLEGVHFKVPQKLSYLPSLDGGKAFTIYLDHEGLPSFRQILEESRQTHPEIAEPVEKIAWNMIRRRARELVGFLDADLSNYTISGVTMQGDMPVPETTSGRLFYRFDQSLPMLTSGNRTYRSANMGHNISNNPDLFSIQ